MAEAVFLNHLAETLLKNLHSEPITRTSSSIWGLRKQLSRLEDAVKAIKTLLGDNHPQLRPEEDGMESHGLLGKLGLILYEVDDLVDDVASFVVRKDTFRGNMVAKEVRLFFSTSNQLAFVLDVVRRVENITKILHDFGIELNSVHGVMTEIEEPMMPGIDGPNDAQIAETSFACAGGWQDADRTSEGMLSFSTLSSVLVADLDRSPLVRGISDEQSGEECEIDAHRTSRGELVPCFGEWCGSIYKGISDTRVEKKSGTSGKRDESDEDKSEKIVGEKENIHSRVPDEVIGRDDDRKALVELLLGSGVYENVSVMPIVGLGGLGKTTLAKLVYNDEKVKDHFEIRMWVCIKGVSSKREIIKKILKSAINKKPSENLGLEQLESQLREQLEGKLYLLVLDDAWNEDAEEWHYFRIILSKGARGSKIMVTTRSIGVADVLGTIPAYELQGLAESSSWELFQMVALKPGIASQHLLTLYGKMIVSKCRGVPLTIRIVGSLLYGKSVEKWQLLLESDFDIVEMLRRSYDELPVNMKRCFAYCSLFPEDYEIKKHVLVSLWLAQCLVEPQQEGQSVEDASEEYFMMLLQRCFFKDVRRDDLDDVISCKMLDTTYYMAQNLAGAGSIVAYSGDSDFDSSIKHVSFNFDRDPSWKIPPSLLQAKKVRTFLWVKEPECDVKVDRLTCNLLISKFRSIRVLDLHNFGIEKLPCSIGELIHLRYLDLSYNDSLKKLPNSITKLQNLQTLKLNFCQKLRNLPRDIGKLINLRCLEIDECDSMTYMPLSLKNLTSLQVLNRFVVSKPSSKLKACGGLRALGTLNHLKRRLDIELLGNWTHVVQEATEARLRNKRQLTDLRINWGLARPDNVDAGYYQALLEALQPHRNLKILYIEGYRGKDFPSWASMDKLASSLPNLVVISIDGCKECRHLPPFGQLPSLKRLTLRYMDGVEYVESNIQVASSALFFPSLEELTLHGFHNLKGWWNLIGEESNLIQPSQSFRHLLKLRIWNCPRLILMPLFERVEVLDLLNVNKKLLEASVRHMPTATSSLSLPSSVKTRQLQNLLHLKRLLIKGCTTLSSFSQVKDAFGGLNSLQFLAIDGCDSLSSFSGGLQQLTSLEELEISNCRELDFSDEDNNGMPWKSLTSLRYLTFRGIPNMVTLPAGLKYAVTLKFLWISACNGLATLPEWISSLTSLGHLRIEGCVALTKLPQGLKHLQSLVKVEITECPQLMERCREPTGEDWPYIKHARVLLYSSWRYEMLSETQDFKRWQGHAQEASPSVDNVDDVVGSDGSVTRTREKEILSTSSQDSGTVVFGSAVGGAPITSRKTGAEIMREGPHLEVERPKFQPFTGNMYKLR